MKRFLPEISIKSINESDKVAEIQKIERIKNAAAINKSDKKIQILIVFNKNNTFRPVRSFVEFWDEHEGFRDSVLGCSAIIFIFAGLVAAIYIGTKMRIKTEEWEYKSELERKKLEQQYNQAIDNKTIVWQDAKLNSR